MAGMEQIEYLKKLFEDATNRNDWEAAEQILAQIDQVVKGTPELYYPEAPGANVASADPGWTQLASKKVSDYFQDWGAQAEPDPRTECESRGPGWRWTGSACVHDAGGVETDAGKEFGMNQQDPWRQLAMMQMARGVRG